jgi:hypothetical protein
VQNDAPERVNRLMIDFLHGMPVPQREQSTATERAASLIAS